MHSILEILLLSQGHIFSALCFLDLFLIALLVKILTKVLNITICQGNLFSPFLPVPVLLVFTLPSPTPRTSISASGFLFLNFLRQTPKGLGL